MADQYPPVLENLHEFSSGDLTKLQRYSNLIAEFEHLYGTKPQYVVRAPGRVNTIGEHIDYSGYSVLPMAIAQDIACVFSTMDHGGKEIKMSFANANPLYQPLSVTYSGHPNDITIQKSNNWFGYVMCGVKGLVESERLAEPVSISALFSGTVPPSAGLSSSSALVCCSALMTAVANGVSMTKVDFATMCASCEHLIGTEGGGMDQAISFLAEAGTAKLVTFKQSDDSIGKIPKFKVSGATTVPLPEGVSFVVANSLVKADKAATTSFNERVAECRLATKVIAKKSGLSDWGALYTLGQVEEKLGVGLRNMPSLVDEILHKDSYSKEEICSILGMDSETLERDFLYATPKKTHFELYKRAKHCYTEAVRVLESHSVATSGDLTSKEVATELGKLMNESHASCRDLYECSQKDLDQLVATCVSAGAYGARLTGAGWGGCAVALIPSSIAKKFIEEVKERYYVDKKSTRAEDAIFISQSGGGASSLKLQQ